MRNHLFPKTTTRVADATAPQFNERIHTDMYRRLASYRDSDEARIRQRLDELEREWDTERTLEANASAVILVTLALGKAVDKKWYLFPAVVAGFLLQHAVQGWCPPLPVFRLLGVRTAGEIEEEKQALLALLRKRGT